MTSTSLLLVTVPPITKKRIPNFNLNKFQESTTLKYLQIPRLRLSFNFNLVSLDCFSASYIERQGIEP